MTDRRYDLDWLRIAAFGLLILYHVGMFYVTWDWHVKSSRASDALEPIMLLTNPWRLTLLFLVAGAASRFMWDKMSAGGFTLARMGRLWPPLLLAVFVVVPPQAYYEIVEAIRAMPPELAAQYSGALDNFYVRYVTASGNWCDAYGCLTTPTWNHMWFVAYLIVYTLLLLVFAPLLKRAPKALSVLIAGPLLILTPWLIMWMLRAFVMPVFEVTHALVDDWYNHFLSFGAFLFGFAIAKHEAFFERCVRWRYATLALFLLSYAVIFYAIDAYPFEERTDFHIVLFRGVREMQAWCAILAAIGFAHKYLANADGPIRRMLTQAIFPFYLIHQTIIVVVGHYLDPLQWPLWLEGTVLIAATALGCWLFYQLARWVPPLRVWVGLPSKIEQNPGSVPTLSAGEAR